MREGRACIKMPLPNMNRDDAWALLTEYTKSESLLKHALAVEAAVRGYARKFGEDEDGWGIVALLHDFDYERWPTLGDHPFRGSEILREQGLSGVGDPRHPVARRLSPACRATACSRRRCLPATRWPASSPAASLVRPSKSVLDLEADSVIKRMKDKAFARGVKREDLARRRRAARPAARGAHHQRHRVHARAGRRARPARNAVTAAATRRMQVAVRISTLNA